MITELTELNLRALNAEELRKLATGRWHPVVCVRCNLVTGLSYEPRNTLCHACNWAVVFEEAKADPLVAKRTQKLTEAAETLTKGASILPARSNRLPRGVHAPFVNDPEV